MPIATKISRTSSGDAVDSASSRVGRFENRARHKRSSRYRRSRRPTEMRGESTDSPPPPEKMLLVSDGTSSIPTTNVTMTATACRA